MAEIRRATEADVETIRRIANAEAARSAANFAIEPESAAHWMESFRRTSEFYPWLLTTGGFAKAGPFKTRGAYAYEVETSIYIEPDHRGKGLGRALYQKLFEVLQAQGYHSVLAGITLPNEASVRLHESFGMRKVAEFAESGWKFDRWWSVGYWQKLLQSGAARPIRPVADVYTG